MASYFKEGHGLTALDSSTAIRALEHAPSDGQGRRVYHEALRTLAEEGQSGGPPGLGIPPLRQHDPGGSVFSQFLHPAWTTMEWSRRILPEEGWFSSSLTPQKPYTTQIGAFLVPKDTSLWLFDYEFTAYRPSGVDPGDFVVAEEGRFSNQIGGDLIVNNTRPARLSINLNPAPPPTSRQQFASQQVVTQGRVRSVTTEKTNFDFAAATFYGQTTGAGTALLPLRSDVMGARRAPLTFVVDEGNVAMNFVIFNRVRSPLACLQGRLGGLLIHNQVSRALINRVRPQ